MFAPASIEAFTLASIFQRGRKSLQSSTVHSSLQRTDGVCVPQHRPAEEGEDQQQSSPVDNSAASIDSSGEWLRLFPPPTGATMTTAFKRQRNQIRPHAVADSSSLNMVVVSADDPAEPVAKNGGPTHRKRARDTPSAPNDQQCIVDDGSTATKEVGSNGLILHVKMLAVVAVPIAAVIVVFGLSVHDCFVMRDEALNTVADFEMFAEINALVTGVRAERGLSISAIILGDDVNGGTVLDQPRNVTDEAMKAIRKWPSGLQAGDVDLRSKSDLAVLLNDIRARIDAHKVDYNYIVDFYSNVTSTFMDWLEVSVVCIRNVAFSVTPPIAMTSRTVDLFNVRVRSSAAVKSFRSIR
jgi:hypothetical protein